MWTAVTRCQFDPKNFLDCFRPRFRRQITGSENFSYGASKAAVHMLTRKLAATLAAEKITVNAIAPGPFPSTMMAFLLEDEESDNAVAASVPLGRVGSPEDAAGLAFFLSSRAGAYLTGAVIPLDGGVSGTC